MSRAVQAPVEAVILSAGYGERLSPLTDRCAKPSLPLMNHPLILHNVERLARAGVERIAVNLHRFPESITRLLEAAAPVAAEIRLSREPSILGTGGGVRAAAGLLRGGAPLVVANADSLADLDLRALAARHAEIRREERVAATLAVRPRRPEDPYTPVHVDASGRVCGIGSTGKTGEPHVFMGVQILEPAAIASLPAEGPSELVRDLYLPLLARGERLGAFRHGGWWVEVGSPRLYLGAHLGLLDRKDFIAGLPAEAGTLVDADRRIFAGPGATAGEAGKAERVVLGRGAALGRGSVVRRSLLGREARIGDGARVEDSIVWEGASVETGAEVSGMVILSDADGSRRVPLA